MTAQDGQRIGIAFGLVVLAGLCAPLGACAVLFMKRTHTKMLAVSVALAAGVMLFVSLTEVMSESMEDIKNGSSWNAPTVSAVCYAAFFGGVLLCQGLEAFTEGVMLLLAHHNNKRAQRGEEVAALDDGAAAAAVAAAAAAAAADKAEAQAVTCNPKVKKHHHHNFQIHHHHHRHHKQQQQLQQDLEAGNDGAGSVDSSEVDLVAHAVLPETKARISLDVTGMPTDAVDEVMLEAAEHLVMDGADSPAHLLRTCILIGIALSVHNLPEGLATFVGYMSSPHLGLSVALAIALHNIPEGIALGVPIYFATGSRGKAIFWAGVSGMAEPLGALIGLAVQMGGRLDSVAIGVVMSGVAGVMTGVALQELMPRALAFHARAANIGLWSGMAIMAVSLVLLGLLQPSP